MYGNHTSLTAAGETPSSAIAIAIAHGTHPHRHRKTRLGCRPSAGAAQWVERQGCRESATRTGMSVWRVPTERRRSEGTLTKSGPNHEQAPLVTWGWCGIPTFPSNSPPGETSGVSQIPDSPDSPTHPSHRTRCRPLIGGKVKDSWLPPTVPRSCPSVGVASALLQMICGNIVLSHRSVTTG